MKYTPNFSDPRVIKRIKQALGFSLACIGSKPSRWAKVALDKPSAFGQSQNDLSKWLRWVLLITTDDHWSKDEGIPKEYVLRRAGVEYLREVLCGETKAGWDEWRDQKAGQKTGQKAGTGQTDQEDHHLCLAAPAPTVLQVSDKAFDDLLVDAWAHREFGDELASLAFEYEDKSSRLWHPLQNVRRSHKKRLLLASGLSFSYDIVCAAPTLLLRYAQSLPDIPERNIWTMDLWLFAYQRYLKDRDEARRALADLLQVDVSYAKTVLNSLFCGAKVGAGHHFSLFHLLGTAARIQALKDDDYITALRADIKTLWGYIEPTLMRIEKKDKSGKMRKVPLNSKRKWGLYFDLERQVLNVVRTYLEQRDIKHFLEHDGWATDVRLDVADLEQHIKKVTGFTITIEEVDTDLTPATR